jgi:lipocalin
MMLWLFFLFSSAYSMNSSLTQFQGETAPFTEGSGATAPFTEGSGATAPFTEGSGATAPFTEGSGVYNSSSYTSFTPVPIVNQTAYLGLWYQTYSDGFVQATFENSSFCVTAEYGLYPNGTISVLNRERQFSVDGPEREIFGWAAHDNSSSIEGELTVHLQTTNFPAPYWIYSLGPIENDQYQYSVVSDPLLLTLFVLARNLTDFADRFQADILANLTATGFTGFLNTPIPTAQEGCA